MANAEAINKTIEVIRDEENFKFDMEMWLQKRGGTSESYQRMIFGPTCDTAGCIAGAAAVAAGYRSHWGDEVEEIAREFLKMEIREAAHLFVPGSFNLGLVTAGDAIKVLEHLRDTGEVNWDIVRMWEREGLDEPEYEVELG